MTGFFLVRRGWLDDPMFADPAREPFCKRAAWLWLMEAAAYEPKNMRVDGGTITLLRGQLSHSLRFMAEAWGWSYERVRRFLAELRAAGKIVASAGAACDKSVTTCVTRPVTRQMVVSICNYDEIQAPPKNARQVARQACAKSVTDSKEIKKESPLNPPTGDLQEIDGREEVGVPPPGTDERGCRRALGWVQRRFWVRDGSWGPRPDQPKCELPAALLAWAEQQVAKPGRRNAV